MQDASQSAKQLYQTINHSGKSSQLNVRAHHDDHPTLPAAAATAASLSLETAAAAAAADQAWKVQSVLSHRPCRAHRPVIPSYLKK